MEKQNLVGTDYNATAGSPHAPPPYTAPSGYGTAGGGYQQPQQNTTVIVSQPVRTVTTLEVQPPNYLVMSILTMLFCSFWCGLVALIMSLQSNSAWERGDREEAYRLSMAAKKWNIVSIICGVVLLIGYVITVACIAALS